MKPKLSVVKNKQIKSYFILVAILAGKFLLSSVFVPVKGQIISQTLTPQPDQFRDIER